ncbi:unnamed protein product [Ilex paraguariensis]|uniref:Uncharacterized protein n=1 Tax=Ilex paraguariensis TaxID=185542 RepID=A0ABC8UZP4_9AQUA
MGLPGMAADFDVVGMKEISFVALIEVEHRSIVVEVVDSELEITGRFGSGIVFAEKHVVVVVAVAVAGLSQLGRSVNQQRLSHDLSLLLKWHFLVFGLLKWRSVFSLFARALGIVEAMGLPGMAADFDVVGMKEISFVALIEVEHRSIVVEVVDSELEITGRFGSGIVFAEKHVVVVVAVAVAGLSQLGRCSISPYIPFGCLEVIREQRGPEC